jgi:voltage-gated potassium channel
MEKRIVELKNHMVVCGYGRMGQLVCQEFDREGVPYVVLDRQAEAFEGIHAPRGPHLVGDATSDDVLRRAGIERARGLVAAAASDADNLYITMSARFMNDGLFIVARAEEDAAERKLQRAGATRVISPYSIGGRRIAQAVLRPAVMDFIELATRTEHLELQMEEVEIHAGSKLAGVALHESPIRRDLGIIIVGIKRADGRMVFNPGSEVVMEEGDLLITLGHRDQLDRLEALAGA